MEINLEAADAIRIDEGQSATLAHSAEGKGAVGGPALDDGFGFFPGGIKNFRRPKDDGVRHLFARYLELKSVRALVEECTGKGLTGRVLSQTYNRTKFLAGGTI